MNTIEFEIENAGKKIRIPNEYQDKLRKRNLKVTISYETDIPVYNDLLKNRLQITDEDRKTIPSIDLAIKLICFDKKVSISYLHRRMKIGYNKAKSLVEELETRGIISRCAEKNKWESF